jgi:phage N-6-adenine-methyltransferase
MRRRKRKEIDGEKVSNKKPTCLIYRKENGTKLKMGLQKQYKFKSKNISYSTPTPLFDMLNKEFDFDIDICAEPNNAKCNRFYTIEDDAFTKEWFGNVWMNPPYDRNLSKWVKKLHYSAILDGKNKVCLIPVRSNTLWWMDIVKDAEVRFIIGEVNFNEEKRGLWLPLCVLIFGDMARKGTFSTINYKEIRKLETER